MKLAQFPSSQSLQPLPQQIHADTSESVTRSASPADVQNVQNSATTQTPETTASTNIAQSSTNFIESTPVVGSPAPWIFLVVAILIASGAVWLWRAFIE